MKATYVKGRVVDSEVAISNDYNEESYIKDSLNIRINNSNNYHLHFDIWIRYVLRIDNDLYRGL